MDTKFLCVARGDGCASSRGWLPYDCFAALSAGAGLSLVTRLGASLFFVCHSQADFGLWSRREDGFRRFFMSRAGAVCVLKYAD